MKVSVVSWFPVLAACLDGAFSFDTLDATIVSSRSINETSYDFIIAGGGLTGLVVASRLTEDPSGMTAPPLTKSLDVLLSAFGYPQLNVLVVDSGPVALPEPSSIAVPGLYNPAGLVFSNTFGVPQPKLQNKTFLAAAGNVLGGGSIVNALLWFRSSSQEYSDWQKLGATNVTFQSLLPYFEKSENFSAPDPTFAKQANISFEPAVHGTKGPIHVSNPNFYYVSSGNWWEAAQNTNLHPTKDLNSGVQSGISVLTLAVNPSNRTRSDAQTGYFWASGAGTRPNFHLLPNTTVSRVLFSSGKATGVEYLPSAGGPKATVTASKEVLLAAGGVHTPQILQLSGVGPQALLNKLKIPVVANLPGVGTNLQDTAYVAIPYNITNNRVPNAGTFATNKTYDEEELVVYNSQHQGPYVITAGLSSNVAIIPLRNITSNYSAIINEAQSQDPASYLPPGTDPTVLAGYKMQRSIRLSQMGSTDVPASFLTWTTGPGVLLFLSLPLSRGYVNINTTNPLSSPVIDWRVFTDPTDFKVVEAAVLRNRKIMLAPGMASLGAHEISPYGDQITDPAQLQAAISATGTPSLSHMCCTAPQMSLNLGGVVDSNYKVYGVSGLRVIDIAAIPLLPTLPPQAPLYALAERIAVLIKQEYALT